MKMPKATHIILALLIGYVALILLGKAPRPF